jgi:hypothetical protein
MDEHVTLAVWVTTGSRSWFGAAVVRSARRLIGAGDDPT